MILMLFNVSLLFVGCSIRSYSDLNHRDGWLAGGGGRRRKRDNYVVVRATALAAAEEHACHFSRTAAVCASVERTGSGSAGGRSPDRGGAREPSATPASQPAKIYAKLFGECPIFARQFHKFIISIMSQSSPFSLALLFRVNVSLCAAKCRNWYYFYRISWLSMSFAGKARVGVLFIISESSVHTTVIRNQFLFNGNRRIVPSKQPATHH